MIDRLVEARLLTAFDDERGGTAIEIVHEALLEAWPRLVEWHREDREGTRLHEQLRAAARPWDERGRPRGLLWRGDALAEYQLWRRRQHRDLTPQESAFAGASLSDAARGRRLRRRLVALIAIASAGFVFVQWRGKLAEKRLRQETASLLRDSTFEQGRLLALQGDKANALAALIKAYEMGEVGAANRLLIEETSRSLRARRPLRGHTDLVWAAAWSPDGKRIATAGDDRATRIWNAETGEIEDVIRHEGGVHRMAFSPDGKFLAFSDKAGVHLWDVGLRRETVLKFPRGEAWGFVAFDRHSRLLLATGALGQAWVWQLPAAQSVVVLPGLVGKVTGEFCARADCLVTKEDTGTVTMWSTRTLTPTARYRHGSEVNEVAVAPEGSTLALSSATGELILLRRDGTVIARQQAHSAKLHEIAFSPDGALLATGSLDHTAKLWSGVTGEPRGELRGHRANVTGMAFSPDGKLLATASIDGHVRLWSTTGNLLALLDGHTDAVIHEPVFRSDGAQMVTVSWDRSAIVWDLALATQFESLETARPHFIDGGGGANESVAFSHDGSQIAVIVADGFVISRGSAPLCRARSQRPLSNLAWSPDGAHLATVSDTEPVVRIWSTRSCQLESVLEGHKGGNWALAFDPKGNLFTAGDDRTVRVWDATGRSLAVHADYHGAIRKLGFVPGGGSYALADPATPLEHFALELGDRRQEMRGLGKRGNQFTVPASVVVKKVSGATNIYFQGFSSRNAESLGAVFDVQRHRVLSGSRDGTIWVWDDRAGARDARGVREVVTLDKAVKDRGPLWGGLALSPDGSILVGIGGRSPVVRDADNLSVLGQLEGHVGLVYDGGFLAGDIFMTAGQDDIARVWDIRTRRLLLELPGAKALAFSDDRRSVVLSSPGGTRLWRPTFPVPRLDKLLSR